MANWCSFINADSKEPVLINLDNGWAVEPYTLSDGSEGIKLGGPWAVIIVRGSLQDLALVLDARIIDPS